VGKSGEETKALEQEVRPHDESSKRVQKKRKE
jgi:hypothetical protein